MAGERPSFSRWFNDEFRVGPEEWSKAYFGLNVLRGLVEGIDDFVRDSRQALTSRSVGPVLLGSALWINDGELMSKLSRLAGACVVVTKQGRWPRKREELKSLYSLNERLPGLPIRAFPDLGGLAPKVGGSRAVVGPYSPMDDSVLPTFRTLGYRSQGRELVPLLHAKLALLGRMWRHDEGALGHVEDVLGFTPFRLWISSANFTDWSRRHLEFGYWTEEPALLEGAERFLVKLMGSSEDVDPDADFSDPTLAPVEFDDDAFAEYLAEATWDHEFDQPD
jgi:hypothetical protein